MVYLANYTDDTEITHNYKYYSPDCDQSSGPTVSLRSSSTLITVFETSMCFIKEKEDVGLQVQITQSQWLAFVKGSV